MNWKETVARRLSAQIGSNPELLSITPVGGGSINEAYRYVTSEGSFFIKKNSASRYPGMFADEARGLRILKEKGSLASPEVIDFFEEDGTAVLLLRYIESAPKKPDFWESFAKGLVDLHANTADYFGLDHENYIGSLAQVNTPMKRWTDFYRDNRLQPQVRLARDSGRIDLRTVRYFTRFYNRLDEIFPEEAPALIHGDLWGGNFMVNGKGEAVLIDPAVYYGHREMDLAMSLLFGGFDSSFYSYYDHFSPLESGWRKRVDYCNLYPLLVHVNLFGGGYVGQVEQIISHF